MGKSALIVDDSKTARVVLKRILETHDLDVNTAESAESALEYLSDHRPDVIFMDHLMPGMDGFQAVTAIKNNPATATIPIMMYTSQKGELYVGQARALGAVGVLPKQVEPVEVSRVLESLRVIGGNAVKPPESTAETSGEIPGIERFDHDLRELIEDLFDQQRAILRRDFLDSYEAIASRVAEEISPSEEPEAEDEPVNPDNRLRAAVAVLATLVMIFALLYWQREQSWQEVLQVNAQLQKALEQQQSLSVLGEVDTRQRIDQYQQSASSAYLAALRAMEWGVNQSASYAFHELPLDDNRLADFEDLGARLMQMGFSGQVRVEAHVGNFCMVARGQAQFDLAPDTAAVDECDQVGFDENQAFELGLRQSAAFSTYFNLSAEQTQGRILYDIVSLGNTEPLIVYPISPIGISAGEWNDIAAANNRVVVSLIPDDLRSSGLR